MRRAVLALLAMCVLTTTSCTSSSTSTGASGPARSVVWSKQPWALVQIHPTDEPKIMLIDMAQSTRNTQSPCWIESRTATHLGAGRFEITLWLGHRTANDTGSCAALAVRGRFYATVHLPTPFDGEPLVDPVSGRNHHPGDRVHLADAPPRFR